MCAIMRKNEQLALLFGLFCKPLSFTFRLLFRHMTISHQAGEIEFLIQCPKLCSFFHRERVYVYLNAL